MITQTSSVNLRLKYASLVFLTLQTTCLVTLMRISRISVSSHRYLISTIVVCSEVAKLSVCTLAVVISEGGWLAGISVIHEHVFVNFRDTIHVLLPSALYTIQNNLLYVAISNLNAVTYQLVYQSKIFTTALFMIILMNKKLSKMQWFSLTILFTGVLLSSHKSDDRPHEMLGSTTSFVIGLLALSCASLISGFAGVYFESILKGTAPSIWIRNVQLALFGVPVALCAVFVYDREAVLEDGFFQGYCPIVWAIVVLQTCSGLGVAFVMKYADNILKGFAAGLSIILSSIFSYFIGDFTLNAWNFSGATLVIAATILYGYVSQPKVDRTQSV